MSRHRFFITPDQIKNDRVVLSAGQAHQLSSVLRLKKGDHILVLDNSGWQFELVLTKVEPSTAVGNILDKQFVSTEPAVNLTLYQSLLKRDRFEWVLQKGTELGITSFVPVVTQRTIVRQKSAGENKMTRWQRIVGEAAEQSGRGRIPNLAQPLSFKAALLAASNDDISFISWENEEEQNITMAYSGLNLDSKGAIFSSAALFIGPEGGFTEDEIDDAKTAGVIPVTLGPRTLRAETAAIVATTLILHELGELK